MKEEFEKRGADVKMQRRLKNNEEMEIIAAESDLIVYAAYVAGHKPMGGQVLYGEECATFLSVFTSGKEKSIGVSMGYPYLHYDIMGQCPTFINAYSKNPEMMQVFVESIYGENPITGKSPFRLKPFYDRWD